jgi:hypothetical protein
VAGANRELGAALGEMKSAVEAIDGAMATLQTASDSEFGALRGALKGHVRSPVSGCFSLSICRGGCLCFSHQMHNFHTNEMKR